MASCLLWEVLELAMIFTFLNGKKITKGEEYFMIFEKLYDINSLLSVKKYCCKSYAHLITQSSVAEKLNSCGRDHLTCKV